MTVTACVYRPGPGPVPRWSVKRVVLDCSSRLAKEVIVAHVKDVHLGRRNYHYVLSGLVSFTRLLIQTHSIQTRPTYLVHAAFGSGADVQQVLRHSSAAN